MRIDHRSYKAQQLDLDPRPQDRLGPGAPAHPRPARHSSPTASPSSSASPAPTALQIIADPTIALKALSHTNATFSHHDIAKFLHTRTESAEQFQTAYLKVTTSPELVALGTDDLGRAAIHHPRDVEPRAQTCSRTPTTWRTAPTTASNPERRTAVLAKHALSPEQERAALEVTGQGDLKSLAGVAGSGKSTDAQSHARGLGRGRLHRQRRRARRHRRRESRTRRRHQVPHARELRTRLGSRPRPLDPPRCPRHRRGRHDRHPPARARARAWPKKPTPKSCWSATPSNCRPSKPAPRSAASPPPTASPTSPKCAARNPTGNAPPPRT